MDHSISISLENWCFPCCFLPTVTLVTVGFLRFYTEIRIQAKNMTERRQKNVKRKYGI